MTERPSMQTLTRKKTLSRIEKIVRLLTSCIDPRAYLHFFRILNFYNYTHVQPRRKIHMGNGCAISPDVIFTHGELITIGNKTNIGSRCQLRAGPSHGKIIIGDYGLLGPEVAIIASQYRYNDGEPVTKQLMNEADVCIGRDVWIGTKAIIMPGVTIGDGAIIGAGTVVTHSIPERAIAVGVPARVIATRNAVH